MTSERQLAANRANARHSTGPRTQAGKARSRSNALRHGLCAQLPVTSFENGEAYRDFEADLFEDYNAHTAIAEALVRRLASLLWRLSRASAIEAGLIDIQADILAAMKTDPAKRSQCCRACDEQGRAEMRLDMGMSPPSHDRRELARFFLRLEHVTPGFTDRLSRYEAALWRQARQTILALEAFKGGA